MHVSIHQQAPKHTESLYQHPNERKPYLEMEGNKFPIGPEMSRIGLLSKLLCLAQISRNVTKMGQHGSGSPRAPKTALGCKNSILAILDRSGPVEKRPFISKLLCLARISRNVTKMGQHGSGSRRASKTALGCKNLIFAISDRS